MLLIESENMQGKVETQIEVTKDNVVFIVKVPNMSAKNLSVKVEYDILVINGRKNTVVKSTGEKRVYTFEQAFNLSEFGLSDVAKSKAVFNDGTLTVTIPASLKDIIEIPVES